MSLADENRKLRYLLRAGKGWTDAVAVNAVTRRLWSRHETVSFTICGCALMSGLEITLLVLCLLLYGLGAV